MADAAFLSSIAMRPLAVEVVTLYREEGSRDLKTRIVFMRGTSATKASEGEVTRRNWKER